MFRLEHEIDAWCQSIYESGCRNKSGIEELKDHLYCEIERLMSKGLFEKQAFIRATERMGKAEDLFNEYFKNRNVFSRWRYILNKRREMMTPKQLAVAMGVYLIFFALITATATRLWGGTEYFEELSVLLYTAWVMPLYMFPAFQKSSKAEWECLKRFFGSLKKSG